MRKVFFFVILIGLGALLSAQPINQRKDWFFGRKASVHFDALNIPSFGTKNPNSVYTKMASAYLRDGTLAFKTVGSGIYDINTQLVKTLNLGSAIGVQVVNHSSNDSLFNIITLTGAGLYHTVYDYYTNEVVQEPSLFENNPGRSFLMIKHCYAEGFWIVAPRGDKKWQTYYLQESTIQKGPESPMPFADPEKMLDVTSSFKGDKIAASTYAEDGFVTLYDFDSKCGVVSNASKLPQSTTQIPWDFPLGIDFSPNDRFLYVCYSRGLSQLVQYRTDDVTKSEVIHSTTNDATQFDDILMAPDGKAYLNRHNFGVPSRQIDVIESPNVEGIACTFKQNVHQLAEGTNGGFQFPPFINAYTSNFCENSVREFADDYIGTPCVGNTMEFFTRYADNSFTEVKWFIDYNGTQSTASGKGIEVDLTETGILKVIEVKYFCNFSDTLRYEFNINANPVYALTKDTTICDGEELQISVVTDAERIRWSTGDSVKTILAQVGIYPISLSNGDCKVEDTVHITSYPPLSILLGDEFYICERENELVKLDAGKGFVNYLWHPTQDTTQWIIVDKVGDYYVIVDDYRGCKGDKGTEVNERCDLVFFIPNAIGTTHAGDNDIFRVVGDGIVKAQLEIYNRWGEQLFSGDGVKGWDPNEAPEGVYVYRLTVEGFKSKRKIIQHQSGTVTLLK